MKKIIFVGMVLLMAVSYLAGCGQKEQDMSVSGEASVSAGVGAESQVSDLSPEEAKLVGKWKTKADGSAYSVLTFGNDYSYSVAIVEQDEEELWVVGTWELVGNTLTMPAQYQDDGSWETLDLEIVGVTEKLLTLTDGKDPVTFERVA